MAKILEKISLSQVLRTKQRDLPFIKCVLSSERAFWLWNTDESGLETIRGDPIGTKRWAACLIDPELSSGMIDLI